MLSGTPFVSLRLDDMGVDPHAHTQPGAETPEFRFLHIKNCGTDACSPNSETTTMSWQIAAKQPLSVPAARERARSEQKDKQNESKSTGASALGVLAAWAAKASGS